MKLKLIAGLAWLATILSAGAVEFNVNEFGSRLGGWQDSKGAAAKYKSSNSYYRTYRPTITRTPKGGLFISTKIQHLYSWGAVDTSFLEMTFDSSGEIMGAQVKIKMGGRAFDTGYVKPEPIPVDPAFAPLPVAPAGGEPAPLPPVQMTEIVVELFKRLDEQISKWAQEGADEQKKRRDLVSRIGRWNSKVSAGRGNMSAVIRHNYNMIAASVGQGGGGGRYSK